MANVIINDTHLNDIADSIRSKNGTSTKYKPSEMAVAISNIPVGEDVTVEVTQQNDLIVAQSVTIDDIKLALQNKSTGGGEVVLQEKTVTPTKSSQTITPDENYDGLSKVTVNPIGEEYVIPTGTLKITSNGTHDVTNYASATVDIPNEDLSNELTAQETLLDNQTSKLIVAINNLKNKASGGADTSEIEEAFIKRTFTEYSNDTITSIGNSAFRSCTSLTSVSFPKSTNTGAYAFYDCTKLTDVNFPIAKTITSQCFRGCTSLVDVTFPEATTIEAYAFYQNTKLKTVRLPKAKNFGISALNGCSSLTALIIEQEDTICSLATNGLANSGIASGTGYVYVPDDKVESYKNATNWSAYASQIKPLSELEG
jgi:hypothetical protein